MTTRPDTPRIDPEIAGDLPAETDAAHPTPRASARKAWAWLLIVLISVGAGLAVWMLSNNQPAPTPVAKSEPPAPPPPVPELRHPIADAQGGAQPYKDAKPLPALAVSDATMQNTIADLFGATSLGRIFFSDEIVHRFVTTVDNLPRKTLPTRYLPVKPASGPLLIAGKEDALSIAADNAARYAAYVQMADAIDAKKIVAVYVHFYPLLQEDYRNLGYPKGYFNDRLIEAIDDMLAAPDGQAPMKLVQPKIVYQYADPDFESRSAGQKVMMRMGSENEAKMKSKLREIRGELTSGQRPDGHRP